MTSHICDIVDYPYVQVYQKSTITNYFINCYWLLILSIVDYPYMCFIREQVNMCDILLQNCCKKSMGHSRGFSNL